jgi:hypothetical protein
VNVGIQTIVNILQSTVIHYKFSDKIIYFFKSVDTFTKTEWIDKLAMYEVTLGQMVCCHQTPNENLKFFRQGNENLKEIK